MSNYILGIDIGGTTAKLGLFSEEHFPEIIVKRSVKTRPDEGGKYILPDIAEGIKQLFEDEGIDKSQIDGIGVGVPGPVIIGDKPGQTLVNKCVNLGWGVKDVAAELSELTGIEKVIVENDANAAALGEIICGSVRDMA
ncbi:MAG: ROK family protein, partial [Lachnospiraceae bacterium]|nr:ROK family protein [Lachnospiraceae bacterium]